jgi:predicted dehydrogenase
MSETIRVGFLGAGAIARCHAFAMNALRYYYDDAPEIQPMFVASARAERAQQFARQYGFKAAMSDVELLQSPEIDAVFVLGPNRLHFEHARRALLAPRVRRVYIEKPLCVTDEEAEAMGKWAGAHPDVWIQPGYQLLHMASIRRALEEWKSGALGAPLHFNLRLLHSGYLDTTYRSTRAARLTPMPEGGALVDLGSHLLSLAVAFLSPELTVESARALSPFPDVEMKSDMHFVTTLRDAKSGALGTVTASRIAAGHEAALDIEFSGTLGAIRVSSHDPDAVEICTTANRQDWKSIRCASDFSPESRFPSRAEAAGWLRPLIHAHYLFFRPRREEGPLPDLAHGLAVQRLIGELAKKCIFTV